LDTKIAKATIKVIRKERRRRIASLPDHPDAAYDQWLFFDEPFINELCLILLVAVRHQVERELLSLAARVTDGEMSLTAEQYRTNVAGRRNLIRRRDGWKAVEAMLGLESFPDWKGALRTLQLVANCYKHAPSGGPEPELLRHLRLDEARNYASLPESGCIREGLAQSIDLQKDADYSDIAEELLTRSDRFLKAVRRQPIIAKVRWGPVSFSPEDTAC
jgi:hypothetical protein